MPIEMYQTGKEKGFKGIGDLPWEAFLGAVVVGPRTAEKMLKAIQSETAVGTFLELRSKGDKIEGTEIRRDKTFYRIEGLSSELSANAALAAKEPPHDKESIRRAATKSVRAKVEKNDGPKGYKSARVETGKLPKKKSDPGYIDGITPSKKGEKGKKEKKTSPPNLKVVGGLSEAVRSVPVNGELN